MSQCSSPEIVAIFLFPSVEAAYSMWNHSRFHLSLRGGSISTLVTTTHETLPTILAIISLTPAEHKLASTQKGAYASTFLDTWFMLPFAAPHDFQCSINRE